MKEITRLYPGGKEKAFNITYDDGVLQDVRFVHLLNRYGLKGTFNLNSQLMQQEFAWIHESGLQVRRLPPEAVRELYRGHEVASHTLTHPYMQELDWHGVMHQMGADRWNLEQLLGQPVEGFAVPFSYYSDLIADCARDTGFAYARMSEFSGSYMPCSDWYHWKTGIFHLDPGLEDFVDGFFATAQELAVCQIVGHSYDLEAEDLWDTMEGILARMAAAEEVWSCTNLELVRYLQAMQRLEISDSAISNPGKQVLWLGLEDEILKLQPGARCEL